MSSCDSEHFGFTFKDQVAAFVRAKEAEVDRILFGDLTSEEKLEVENSALKLELDQLYGDHSRQKATISYLRTQCDAKDEGIKRLREELKEYPKLIQQEEKKVAAMNSELVQLREQHSRQKESISHLRSMLDADRKELLAANLENEKLSGERDEAKAFLSKERANNSVMHDALAAARKERDRAYELKDFELLQLVARLRREKLALFGDYAAVLASLYEENPEQTRFMEALEDLTEQMNETIQGLKGGGE